MTITKAAPQQLLTFEQYLDYEPDDDRLYELVDGALVPMTPVSPEHSDIVDFLYRCFLREIERLGHDWRVKQLGVGVRTRATRARLPDLCVIDGADWRQLKQQQAKSAVLQVPLLMAVEVVSPGKRNRKRDYEEKRQEYQQRGIGEYWIIDAAAAKLTQLLLSGGVYQETVFSSEDTIRPQLFPDLSLTVDQILAG